MALIFTDRSRLSEGITGAVSEIGKGLERKSLNNILNPQPAASNLQSVEQEAGNRFLNFAQDYENQTGQMLDPSMLDQIWDSTLQQIAAERQQQQPGQRKYTTQQLAAISQKNPQLANLLQQNQIASEKMETKAQERLEDRSFKRNEDYLERIDKIQNNLPAEKLSLQQMRAAIQSGDFGSLRNTIGDITGQEWLKNAPAQTVNSALKTFLISNLENITGRPNQFLEKMISQAAVNPQYKDAANELILQGLENLHELRRYETELASDLEEKFTSRGKEIPRNFQKVVKDKVQKRAKEFEDKYEKKSIKLLGIKPRKGFILVKTPEGLKQVPRSQKDLVIRKGGEIIDVD